jgi:hypothetical protein
MFDRRVIIWIGLFLGIISEQSSAGTWFVEKDGSGDYATIHEAMVACSAGDTIMIGPGRYDDFHPLIAPAWTTEAIVVISKDNLTFIGSGDSTTIIGPTEMYLPGIVPEPMAIASVENIRAKFMNIGVENARNGIYWSHGWVEIDGCRFDGCKDGVYLFNEGGASIIDSDFYSEESLSKGVITFSPCGPVTISGCAFGGAGTNGISINGTSNVSIENCHFSTLDAIVFAGSSGTIGNCTTTEYVGQSVWVTDASQVDFINNKLHGSYTSIYVNGWSIVNGSGNVFSGGEDLATIFITSQSQVTLNNNDIIKSGDYAAKIGQYFYEIVTNDLTNNYWGTSDPDSIEAWIWDYDDDPVTRAYIDYIPFSDIPLPTEKKSLGGVKAMFR